MQYHSTYYLDLPNEKQDTLTGVKGSQVNSSIYSKQHLLFCWNYCHMETVAFHVSSPELTPRGVNLWEFLSLIAVLGCLLRFRIDLLIFINWIILNSKLNTDWINRKGGTIFSLLLQFTLKPLTGVLESAGIQYETQLELKQSIWKQARVYVDYKIRVFALLCY